MLDYLVRCSSLDEMTFADLIHRLVVESSVEKEIKAAELMLKKIEGQEQLLEAQIAAKQLQQLEQLSDQFESQTLITDSSIKANTDEMTTDFDLASPENEILKQKIIEL